MQLSRSFIGVALACSLSSCAIHPLPEDVTKLDTVGIVNHIRCEARDAITSAIGSYLTTQPDEASRRTGEDLVKGRIRFVDVNLKALNSEALTNIKKYLPAAIAFDFTFDMTEETDIGAQADFTHTFTQGIFSIGAKIENDRQRQTVRNFRISDTFKELIGPVAYCDGLDKRPDYVYPISGNIGLAEMVTTFVDLNEFQHLTPAKDAKDKAPVLADTFNFQTIFSGSINPKITLNPIKRGPLLSDAAIMASASRKDIHKVIVALSLAPPSKHAAAAYASAQIIGPAFRITSADFRKTPAEEIAIAEIYNQIERNILTSLVLRQNL